MGIWQREQWSKEKIGRGSRLSKLPVLTNTGATWLRFLSIGEAGELPNKGRSKIKISVVETAGEWASQISSAEARIY